MSEETVLTLKIDVARQRLASLLDRTENLSDVDSSVMQETLVELSSALEELYVLTKELTVRTEELAKSRVETEKQRERYAELFEFAPDGYLVTDGSGVVSESNHAISQMLGADSKRLVGKPLAVFILSEDAILYHGLLRQCQANAGPPIRKLELSLKARDGRVIPAAVRVSCGKDKASGNLVLRWVFRDITDAKHADVVASTRARELSNSQEEVEQYISVLAHDLQEPVRVLATYSMLLSEKLKGKLDEECTMYLNFSEHSASKLLSRIEDMLSYGSLISSHLEVERVNTEDVLKDVLLLMDLKIKETGAEIVYSDMPEVSGSRDLLLRLFENLISNAIKFSPEKPDIRVTCFRSTSQWVFSVRDNGIGLDMQFANRVFGMFQRLHGGEYAGTGVGLAICKRIVDHHHGRIWIESEPGQGTAVFFTIPFEQVDTRPNTSVDA